MKFISFDLKNKSNYNEITFKNKLDENFDHFLLKSHGYQSYRGLT